MSEISKKVAELVLDPQKTTDDLIALLSAYYEQFVSDQNLIVPHRYDRVNIVLHDVINESVDDENIIEISKILLLVRKALAEDHVARKLMLFRELVDSKVPGLFVKLIKQFVNAYLHKLTIVELNNLHEIFPLPESFYHGIICTLLKRMAYERPPKNLHHYHQCIILFTGFYPHIISINESCALFLALEHRQLETIDLILSLHAAQIPERFIQMRGIRLEVNPNPYLMYILIKRSTHDFHDIHADWNVNSFIERMTRRENTEYSGAYKIRSLCSAGLFFLCSKFNRDRLKQAIKELEKSPHKSQALEILQAMLQLSQLISVNLPVEVKCTLAYAFAHYDENVQQAHHNEDLAQLNLHYVQGLTSNKGYTAQEPRQLFNIYMSMQQLLTSLDNDPTHALIKELIEPCYNRLQTYIHDFKSTLTRVFSSEPFCKLVCKDVKILILLLLPRKAFFGRYPPKLDIPKVKWPQVDDEQVDDNPDNACQKRERRCVVC